MPPRLARLLAAVVAVALVAGAFAVRGVLAGDDDETATGDGTTATTGADGDERDDGDGTYRVLCDEDLGEAACAAVADLPGVAEVEVRAAGEVLATAAGDDPGVPWDAWLTLDPMPGVLDTARREAGLEAVSGEVEAVASAPLAVLSFGASPLDCGATVAWTCLLEQDVTPRVATPSPATSLGTVTIAAAASGLRGDLDYSISDFQRTDEADVVRAFVDRSPGPAGATTEDQTAAMLRPGTAAATVTVAGLADRQAGTVQGGNRDLEVLALEPAVVVGVVLAGLGPAGDAAVATLAPGLTEQTVRAALAEGGWTQDPDPTSGLPAFDLVYALREELGR